MTAKRIPTKAAINNGTTLGPMLNITFVLTSSAPVRKKARMPAASKDKNTGSSPGNVETREQEMNGNADRDSSGNANNRDNA